MPKRKQNTITAEKERNKSPTADVDRTADNVRIVLIALLVLSIGILLGVLSFTAYRIHNYNHYLNSIISYDEINASVIVTTGSVGLNGDTDSLKFGKVSVGGGGTRFLNINATETLKVKIYFSGDIAKFLSIEKNEYIIEKGPIEKVPINIDIPKDTQQGNYTGTVHVLLTKP
jgi:hypothetical protein